MKWLESAYKLSRRLSMLPEPRTRSLNHDEEGLNDMFLKSRKEELILKTKELEHANQALQVKR